MSKALVYYSTNTKIAYEINEDYYRDIHFAWCCPFFYQENHPASSTPKEIYSDLSRDVRTKDRHSAKIRENVSGILKGAGIKLNQNVITQQQYDDIKFRVVTNWQLADYKPILFVIPATNEVENLKKEIAIEERAGDRSKEFIIEQLPRTLFDVISLDD